jgi:hypothetical protein
VPDDYIDPSDPSGRRPLDYARGPSRREPISGCMLACVIVMVVLGLLAGTCFLMVMR